MAAKIKVGTKFISIFETVDSDENGAERVTPAGSAGEVISIDDYPSQGVTYGFHFLATGATGYLLEAEIKDSTQFTLTNHHEQPSQSC